METLKSDDTLYKRKTPSYFVCILFSILFGLPNIAYAEIHLVDETIAIPSIALTLPDELKAFNKQLNILEKIVEKKIGDNLE